MSDSMISDHVYRMYLEGTLQYLPGYFLNSEYYLDPEEPPIGRIDSEGNFHYFQTEEQGVMRFADGIGGKIEGLVLTRVDGSRFHLTDMT